MENVWNNGRMLEPFSWNFHIITHVGWCGDRLKARDPDRMAKSRSNTTIRHIHSLHRVMKKTTIFLILAVFSLAARGAVKTENHTVSFSEGDYTFTYDGNGNLVIGTVDGDAAYSSPDEPGLPQRTFSIAIPGSRKYSSSSLRYTKRLIMDDVRIAPGPIPVPTDGSVRDMPARAVKYESRSYPASSCFYSLSSEWSDLSVIHFITTPFVYDAAARKLYFIDSIQLSLRTVERPSGDSGLITFSDRELVKSIVANKDAVSRTPAKRSALSGVSGVQEKIDYVVITNEALKPSFESLINWKLAKGLKSKIITTEEIDSKYQGASRELRIKRCLYDLYQNNSLRYVLLGGDETVVATRGCFAIIRGEEPESIIADDIIPTDLYYSCFGGNFEWDANGNGTYGELDDNVDMTPSIYLTRLPVRTPQHVESFINKLLEYEKNPKWNNNMLMSGVKLTRNIEIGRSDAEVKGEKLYNSAIKPYWSGEIFRFYDSYTDSPESEKYEVSADNLTEQISRGYSFVDMITHGWVTHWETEYDENYKSEHGIRQSNDASTIVTTIACFTNAFDYVYDPCLSESLIRNPGSGVIAYLGCSRKGWYSDTRQGDIDFSFLYESKFYKNLFSNAFPELNYGVLVAASKLAMTPLCADDNAYRWIQFGLNPVGDPEMPIFTSIPQRFGKSIVKESDGEMKIETGVDGCRVCIMSAWDNGESYYRVWDDVRSLSVTDFPSNFSICVTKQNYIPYYDVRGYIQNEILTGNTEMSGGTVKIGSHVTPLKESGSVIFSKGSVTKIKAGNTILESGTEIKKGAEVTIESSTK